MWQELYWKKWWYVLFSKAEAFTYELPLEKSLLMNNALICLANG